MTRPLLLAAVVLAVAPVAAAATRGQLPSPTVPIRDEPPLRTRTAPFSATERRFPRRLDAAVSVHAALDPAGRPAHVTAVDRTVIHGTGDYSFGIPAPATSVVAGPGSASQPGLRLGTVLWQGFSAGRRVLVARIALDARAAARALPVRIEIRPGELRIANATATAVTMTTGAASPRPVAAAFQSVQTAVRRQRPIAAPTVFFTGPTRRVKRTVHARLHVTGSYRFADGVDRTISRSLGSGLLRFRGRGDLRRLDIRVRVEDPTAPLARTATAVGPASERIFESALAAQYRAYIANPDPTGKTSTSYRFTLAPTAAEATTRNGGSGPWVGVGVALAAVAVAAGGLVLWAHS